jgi:hypothetical protein
MASDLAVLSQAPMRPVKWVNMRPWACMPLASPPRSLAKVACVYSRYGYVPPKSAMLLTNLAVDAPSNDSYAESSRPIARPLYNVLRPEGRYRRW